MLNQSFCVSTSLQIVALLQYIYSSTQTNECLLELILVWYNGLALLLRHHIGEFFVALTRVL